MVFTHNSSSFDFATLYRQLVSSMMLKSRVIGVDNKTLSQTRIDGCKNYDKNILEYG